jgi:hypothetical protein
MKIHAYKLAQMAYMKMNYKKNVPHVSLIAEPVPKMTKTVLRAT